MKILELRAENIKNLKVVDITPGEGAVILEGRNGAGKSAILDSLFMALTGRKIEKPIRDGETRAEIVVDLGDMIVRRAFTEKGDRLSVSNKEGATFGSPQTMLNKMLGDLSFDPLSFAEKGKTTSGAREQRNILAALVGLDFTEMNKRREQLYNERTVKNREIKGGDPDKFRPNPNAPLPLEALVGAMPRPEDGTPRIEISMADEVAKVTAIEAKEKAYQDYLSTIQGMKQTQAINNQVSDDCEKEIEDLRQEIKRIEAEIVKLQEGNEARTKRNAEISSEIAEMEVPEEITPEQITEARGALLKVEETNKKIREAKEYDAKLAQLDTAKKEIASLEDEMAKIDLEKQRRVNEAKFPIAGLGITDEYVTYNGKPFGQLSTGEQIRVSTAVAMSLNPQLKIIIIREGSLLDKEGLESIIALAAEKDYQVWIERVSDSKNVGIFIEEGEIKDEQAKQPLNV
jgi:hypothetical protein